jgi:molybdenum cofactor biosynthesis enzyme MoaA
MKIQTMSVIAGDERCNAHCPFCIGKATIDEKVKKVEINKKKLKKAIMLAKQGGVTNIIITGKGEPALNRKQVDEYILLLADHFPFIELQTNGLNLLNVTTTNNEDWVECWARSGLTAISVSVVHFSPYLNASIYTKGKAYPSLEEISKLLHKHGLLMRLNFTMMTGFISSTMELKAAINYCKEIGVDQVTFRPLKLPSRLRTENKEINDWIMRHLLSAGMIHEIKEYPGNNGAVKLMELSHDAVVYDYQGQNLCMTDCLTVSPTSEEGLRQIIFYPDGRLTYDWQYEGAILMRGE